MKVKFIFAWLVILSVGIQPVFAQTEEIYDAEEESVIVIEVVSEETELAADEEPAVAAETAAEDETAVAAEAAAENETTVAVDAAGEELDLEDIRNNPYFLESRRLAKLAQETYDYGDYGTAEKFAQEAARYAEQSDVYVAMVTAKYRLDQAESSGASKQYPSEYGEAQAWYAKSVEAKDNEEWGNALEAANKTIGLLAGLDTTDSGTFPLPATYTVRSWITFKDCLWNIAGRPWVYGDPHKWRTLYDANKSKLPNPNNPNWLEPGITLDIPAIKGETRQGEWEEGRTYTTFK
jgi:nucleoid-associated protein YgaU